jgi:hypothetical protein
VTRKTSSEQPGPGDKRKPAEWHPLTNRSARVISLASLVMLAIGSVGIVTVILVDGLVEGTQGKPLDVISTALGVVGGGFAVLFGVRQIRVKELTLQQALDDASDRRDRELQETAAQFCEPKPARIAHLHTLDGRARRSTADRRYVVEVLCTYLRMHFEEPSEFAGVAADDERYKQWKLDCEIRKVAQRVLAGQLRPDVAACGVGLELDIDLTGAVLIDFDLSGCRIGAGRFDHARFIGNSDFSEADFTGSAWFVGVTFTRDTLFEDVKFFDKAVFAEVAFERYATFHGAYFDDEVEFRGAMFERHAVFDVARFAGDAIFDAVQVRGSAGFDDTKFKKEVGFGGAVFLDVPTFDGVEFSQEACAGKIAFGGAAFAEGTPPEVMRFLDAGISDEDGAEDDRPAWKLS